MPKNYRTKDLPEDAAPPEDVPETPEEGSDEPYSAQVLRRMHKDASILLEEYDEMAGPLEHDKIKGHLQEKLEALVSELEEIEDLFGKHHEDLPELEGAGTEEKDLEEDDGVPKDESEDDSREEKEPTPEEAMEGMEKEEKKKQEKSLRNGHVKSLRRRIKGMDGDDDEEQEKALKFYRRAKGLCPTCGKSPCICGKSLRKSKKDYGIEDSHEPGEEALREEGKAFDANDDHSGDTAKIPGEEGHVPGYEEFHEKSLPGHHVKAANGAAGFLEQVPTTQDWTDEHRMEAYHHSKSLGSAVEEAGTAALNPADREGEVPKFEGEEGHVPGYEEFHEADADGKAFPEMDTQDEAAIVNEPGEKAFNSNDDHSGDTAKIPGEEGHVPGYEEFDKGFNPADMLGGDEEKSYPHPHYKAMDEAGQFLGELSKAPALTDEHREKAMSHCKELNPMLHEMEAGMGLERDATEEVAVNTPKPGTMGEKSANGKKSLTPITALKKTFIAQQKQMVELSKTLRNLRNLKA